MLRCDFQVLNAGDISTNVGDYSPAKIVDARSISLNGQASVFLRQADVNGLAGSVLVKCGSASTAFYANVAHEVVICPPAPKDFKKNLNSDGTIDFTWTDVSNNETYFFIEQHKDDGSWERIAVVPANTTSYHYTPQP